MSASTTAVFTALGVPFSDFLDVVQNLVGTTIHFSLDILVQLWPFWLGLALLGVILVVIFAFLHFFRRRG